MRWEFMKRNILVSLAAFLLAATSALAQTGTTSVRGTVIDKSGAAIVGATVTLGSQRSGAASSNENESHRGV